MPPVRAKLRRDTDVTAPRIRVVAAPRDDGGGGELRQFLSDLAAEVRGLRHDVRGLRGDSRLALRLLGALGVLGVVAWLASSGAGTTEVVVVAVVGAVLIAIAFGADLKIKAPWVSAATGHAADHDDTGTDGSTP